MENNKKLNDNTVYTLLFKDNKSIKCIISINKLIDSPKDITIEEFYVKNMNDENYIHIIQIN